MGRIRQRGVSTTRFQAIGLATGAIGPVDITIGASECLGLSAPSGAGKTRLLRAMADLDAHHGECRLDGVAAVDMPAPEWRRRVAFLAAESAWWADTPRPHFERDCAPLLDALDLSISLLDQPIERLSSGQKQRLALARTLALTPDVLLLDEPTANLDDRNIERVERLVGDYLSNRRACCIWVSHDRAQRERVASSQCQLDSTGQPIEASCN